MLNSTLLAIRTSALLLATDAGSLIDPGGYINESASASTSWGAALPTDATGDVGDPQAFNLVSPDTLQGRFSVLVRARWAFSGAAGGGAPFLAVNYRLILNGEIIAEAQGTPQAVAATGAFTDIVELVPTASFVLAPGDTFGIEAQPEITTASGAGGSTCEVGLFHDPSNPTTQLVFEIQGLKN